LPGAAGVGAAGPGNPGLDGGVAVGRSGMGEAGGGLVGRVTEPGTGPGLWLTGGVISGIGLVFVFGGSTFDSAFLKRS